MTHAPDLAPLQAHIDGMPPARALGFRVTGMGPGRLLATAPLALNVNDKGCAFGGSQSALMTIAAWGLVERSLAAAGLEADVYVQDSTVRYLAPLFADLEAEAMPAPGEDLAAFAATLRERGRARIAMRARVLLPAGGDAASFEGRFVAIARREG